MLGLVPLWMLIFLVAWGNGLLLGRIFQWIAKGDSARPGTALTLLLGLAMLSVLGNVYSLFFPVGITATVMAVTLGLLGLVWNRHQVHKSFRLVSASEWILGLGIFLVLLIPGWILSAMPSQSWDDGLYYVQNIKWAEAYGVVPGLGNLQGRLAFNSSWHILQALFGMRGVVGTPMYDLNGFLYGVGCLFVVESFLKWKQAKQGIRLSQAMTFLLPAAHFSLTIFLTAPSADLPVFYLFWISMVLALRLHEDGRLSNSGADFHIVVALSLFALTIKLSAFYMVLLPAYMWVKMLKHKGMGIQTLFVAGMALLFMGPWMARNVMLSGYLIYPFHGLDLFQVDWKIPHVDSAHMNCLISNWAKIPNQPCHIVAQMTMAEWVPVWFSQQIGPSKILILMSLAVFAGAGAWITWGFLRLRKKFLQNQEGLIIVFLIVVGAWLFWFLSSPNIRFGLGIHLFATLLPVGLLWKFVGGKLPTFLNPRWVLVIMLLPHVKLYHNVLNLVKQGEFDASYIMFPASLPGHELAEAESGGRVIYLPSTSAKCWDAPLPCTCSPRPELQFRGKSLADGFKTVIAPGRQIPTFEFDTSVAE